MPAGGLSSRPCQAVILAGGRGTRLGDITRNIPKPMVPFGGVPFIGYLLRHLSEQGFERILFLLGYKAESIIDYCGDGSRFGLKIDYSVGAVEDDTGRRMKQAEAKIESVFLLLYCDNYWPMPFARMWQSFSDKPNAVAQITVYRNRDRFTRDNLVVGADGFVKTYDKRRTMIGLAGVDIGFIFLRREVLDLVPADANCSFEAEVYPKLIERGELAAFETDHRYYSVSTPERLPETERFLLRRPCVILDRDGVLNAKASRGEYVTLPKDWHWLPGARESCRALCQAGADVIVITNQAGIARGMLSEDNLSAIHTRMRAEAEAAGGAILDIFYCPHHWDDGCDCRKPNPGMLLAAQRTHALDLSRTPFVGDDPRDREAAAAVDEPFFEVAPDKGLAQAMPAVLEFVRRTARAPERIPHE
jgi:D-glycero-D-manno-heptose 1,7-bisphosphate phosphatase